MSIRQQPEGIQTSTVHTVMAAGNGMFHLESPAFCAGERIPLMHAAEGLDLSPPLRWAGAPHATKTYALICEDPDAASAPWVHWVVFNIPAPIQALPAGLDRSPELPNGARQGLCWGVDTFSRLGYQGPQPPPGQVHRYDFALYALDQALALEPKATVFALRAAFEGHVLAESHLMAIYGALP